MSKHTMPWNIQDLKDLYQYTSSGHWFDADSMRFFKTRLTSHFKRLDDNSALFVTTEKGPNGERKASVRLAKLIDYTRDMDGRECTLVSILTVGDFNTLTLAQAKTVLKNYGAK